MTKKLFVIEKTGDANYGYESLVVDPKHLSIFKSQLPLKIIHVLSKKPGCAMDVAKELKEHEQKIYYHLRKLEEIGVVRVLKKEKRYGMIAKIYGVIYPFVSVKLCEAKGVALSEGIRNIELERFLNPFIENGELNAVIVCGDPYPHGKYDMGARATVHAIDIMLLIGSLLRKMKFPHYKFDTQVSEKELRENNLIIFSNPKVNTVLERINHELPVYFDPKNEWAIVSKITGNVYRSSRCGVILKCKSPFNTEKKILVFAGVRTRGMKACVVAFTKYFNTIIETPDTEEFVRIVEGLDRDGDGVIDSVKVLE
ncbi:MAG: hypothetical protein DRP15_01230 [Candidatus Aenigmatarchaeota archaeon]|nr:MAG: hypothetical protein DRP15_01230 [Candidatus Aenigmarchaeota archaeon]